MDWKIIAIVNIVICVAALPPRTATSEQKFIKYLSKEEKINVGSENLNHKEYVGSYPSYEFSYKVSDPHSHDFKGQQEKRFGDKVNGDYWLIEPDGRKRLVKYHANNDIGFNVLIDYSQKGHQEEKGEQQQNEENTESESGNKNEKGKIRSWHVIQDIKTKKNSNEKSSKEGSNERAAASKEVRHKNIYRKIKEQESEGSQSSQEKQASNENNSNGRHQQSQWNKKKEKSNRQQMKSVENSKEQENTGQAANSGEKSKNENSGEKRYWYYIPHKYLKKGYEVVEEINEDNDERNEGANESNEKANENKSSNNSGESSNGVNAEDEVQQNGQEKESDDNKESEKAAFGYKSYVYHIYHQN